MSFTLAFVGAGPTTIYCLDALLRQSLMPRAITIFERQRRAGQGTPYTIGWSDPVMLSNIASIEIPPLSQSLVDWMAAQPDEWLDVHSIERKQIDERAFYPRIVIGEYLGQQFDLLVKQARDQGITVDVRTRCDVRDVAIVGQTIELSFADRRGAVTSEPFDYVVLATGHQWPSAQELRPGYFTSPFPASSLSAISNCAVGIRGSSLSAIDAAVVLATNHGEFASHADSLDYLPSPGTEAFSMTLFSRKGLLPEADFFHPIPYEPLVICTAEAVNELIERDDASLLDDTFELFRRELTLADPAYADRIGLARLTIETIGDAYFAERTEHETFDWARRNLAEAKENAAQEYTVGWRYAILRMHETVTLIVPHLDDGEYRRFIRYFKPVFVDDYATVPHESIERLLALHTANKLAISQVDDRMTIDTHRAERGAIVRRGAAVQEFPAFIEATGQPVLGAKNFPFPSLLRRGAAEQARKKDGDAPERGIAVDDEFHPLSALLPSDRLFCLSIPYLLGQYPFAQGITSSHEMGKTVAEAIVAAEAVGDWNSTSEDPLKSA